MKRVQRSHAKAGAATRGLLSHALVFFALFAFVFQGYLVQTHIHVPGAKSIVDIFDGAQAPGKNKAPGKDDPANCPLCQQFASAGHYVTPSAAAALLPSLSVSVIEIVATATVLAPAVSHNWRGRAPPHA
jgi:hypothetical protein